MEVNKIASEMDSRFKEHIANAQFYTRTGNYILSALSYGYALCFESIASDAVIESLEEIISALVSSTKVLTASDTSTTADSKNVLLRNASDIRAVNQPVFHITTRASPYDDVSRTPFSCRICRLVWLDPVTLSCGHTFCRSCIVLDSTTSRKCVICQYQVTWEEIELLHTSFLLAQVVEKWFPAELNIRKLKEVGNTFIKGRMYDEAISFFSSELSRDRSDMRLVCFRCDVLTAAGKLDEALVDADTILVQDPDWTEGYCRKGLILSQLNMSDEAAFMYIQCLILDSKHTCARMQLKKVLLTIFTSLASKIDIDVLLDDAANKYAYLFDSGFLALLSKLSAAKQNLVIGEDHRSQSHSVEELPQQVTDASLPLAPYRDVESHRDFVRQISFDAGSNESVLFPESEISSHTDVDDKEQELWVMNVPSQLLNVEDFECVLCSRLLYEPMVPYCGHVFCRECLYRSLDYRPNCPMCKEPLNELLAEQNTTTAQAVEDIISIYFQKEFEERHRMHVEEVDIARRSDVDRQVAIFVVMTVYPSNACRLHVFEPRYRLMIRRCERGPREFGMCAQLSDLEGDFATYGTMLRIRSVTYLDDGRSMVDCVGGRRFRVVSRSERDGYHTARVEYFRDVDVPLEDFDAAVALQNDVYTKSLNLFHSLPSDLRHHIIQRFDEFPRAPAPEDLQSPDGADFVWYMLEILDLSSSADPLHYLSMTSSVDRLEAVQQLIGDMRKPSVTLQLGLAKLAGWLGISVSALVALIVVLVYSIFVVCNSYLVVW